MPIQSSFRKFSVPTPRAAPRVADQPQRGATPPSQDESTRELVVERTFLHFVLGKRRAFRGRRRSASDHLALAKAADSPEKLSSKESMESRRSVVSILATDDERALWTSTHSLSSLREDLPTLFSSPVEQPPHNCYLASTLEAVDDGLPDVLETSFVLTGDERYVHGHGCDGCCDEEDGLSSTRDDASVLSDEDDGFCHLSTNHWSDGCCDEHDDQRIFSLSTAAHDDNSIRGDASVLSDDGFYEHATNHGELSPLGLPCVGAEGNRYFGTASDIAEVLGEQNEIANLSHDSSDTAMGKPATPTVLPWAVTCVINVVVLQPQPAEKGKKAKAKKSKAEPKATATTQPKPEARTTVMLRHLPRDLSQDELLGLLDAKGFLGKYDFVYLPMHFLEQANLGYGFVNLRSPEDVPAFWTAFDGLRKWPKLSTKVLRVGWSNPHQGLAAHIERYRNSPIMHPSVPEEIRPLLFEDGRRVVFPSPTKTVRAPRVRGARGEPAFWNA